MRFLSLFAGIGGFDLGLERAGMTCVGQVENEPYCLEVLENHWPDVKRIPDIRDVKGDEFGPVDLVCGGFPCQPWSVAGKRGGTEDDRDLWPEMRRVIAAVGPQWVLGENVPGLAHHELGLKRVLSDLEADGYGVRTFAIPACAVDAPHRRERLWIVAHSVLVGRGGGRDGNAPRDNGPLQTSGPRSPKEQGDVADAQEQRPQGGGYGDGVHKAKGGKRSREGVPGTGWASVQSAGGGGWLPEPAVGRVAHGVPRRVAKLKALGNSVVPQVVERIGRAILEAAGD